MDPPWHLRRPLVSTGGLPFGSVAQFAFSTPRLADSRQSSGPTLYKYCSCSPDFCLSLSTEQSALMASRKLWTGRSYLKELLQPVFRAEQGGRLIWNDFSFDPTRRHSFWSIVLGGTFGIWGSFFCVTQSYTQRMLACGSRNGLYFGIFLEQSV